MPTATEQVRAALAERISGFPLIAGPVVPWANLPLAERLAWRAAGAQTDCPAWLTQVHARRSAARFTGAPVTDFGGLL